MTYKSTHIVQITDTTDRNAVLKIKSAYAKHAGLYGPDRYELDVAPAYNTLDIGVAASELVHNSERPDQLLLALNCAPAEKAEGTKNNHRSDFFYAELGNGIYVGGTANGLELSYIKGHIKSLFQDVSTNEIGSQFRSLQVLPNRLVRFANPQERERLIGSKALIEVKDIDAFIPNVPDATHAIEIDNFKNVKLWLSSSDRALLAKSPEVLFTFSGDSVEYTTTSQFDAAANHRALVSEKLFDAGFGKNVLALNSSSRVIAGNVPMIATIRPRPGETSPNFSVPAVGAAVNLQRLVA